MTSSHRSSTTSSHSTNKSRKEPNLLKKVLDPQTETARETTERLSSRRTSSQADGSSDSDVKSDISGVTRTEMILNIDDRVLFDDSQSELSGASSYATASEGSSTASKQRTSLSARSRASTGTGSHREGSIAGTDPLTRGSDQITAKQPRTTSTTTYYKLAETEDKDDPARSTSLKVPASPSSKVSKHSSTSTDASQKARSETSSLRRSTLPVQDTEERRDPSAGNDAVSTIFPSDSASGVSRNRPGTGPSARRQIFGLDEEDATSEQSSRKEKKDKSSHKCKSKDRSVTQVDLGRVIKVRRDRSGNLRADSVSSTHSAQKKKKPESSNRTTE